MPNGGGGLMGRHLREIEVLEDRIKHLTEENTKLVVERNRLRAFVEKLAGPCWYGSREEATERCCWACRARKALEGK